MECSSPAKKMSSNIVFLSFRIANFCYLINLMDHDRVNIVALYGMDKLLQYDIDGRRRFQLFFLLII
jgi:hypothetical protein